MIYSRVFFRIALFFILILSVVLLRDRPASCQLSVILETDYLKYGIGSDGKNQCFIDKKTGIDYLKHEAESYCAHIAKDGKKYTVSSISSEGDKIIMEFGESGIIAVVKKTINPRNIILEVEVVREGTPDSLLFVNIPLTLKGMPSDPFSASALSLNLFTNVTQVPALHTHLMVACYKDHSLTGAKTAIIGVPQTDILPAIQDVMRNADGIPFSDAGGAYAMDNPAGYGSYLMDFGDVTEETVDDWIEMVKSAGFNQIDHHGTFRWGDLHLNPEKWPQGIENWKNINKKLHDAGIESIFHSYSFFIHPDAKYVTPVPHPQLDAFRSFTLAAPLSEDADEIEVVESTADISLVTGFFNRNSRRLHIDDELITYKGVTRESPYKFTGCERGAYKTKASSHAKSAEARQLKEMFGLFVPDPESELFREIARHHAEIINYCEFDGIYLDAIDGSDILGGWGNYWYYGPKFIFDMCKYLKRPIGMEMSTMMHNFWPFRSRWQAWDRPTRGYKRFIDIHLASIKTDTYEHGVWRGYGKTIDEYARAINGGLLLPLHLGWWGNQTWNPPQVEPTFTDVIEYLGCKMIGNDAGLSMLGGVDKESLIKNPAFKRLIALIKQYEELRHAKYFEESVKSQLREPGKEFTLFKDADDRWKFRRAGYDVHKVECLDRWSSTWQTNNQFDSQPLKLRIEALMSAGQYDAPDNIVLANFAQNDYFPKKFSAGGVMAGLHSSADLVKEGKTSGCFTALNTGEVSQDGAWVKAEKIFDPWLDLKNHQAMGVWVYGDGQGELLNIRIESPIHISHGARGDHFLTIDFKGWRYFELIEIESSRFSDYKWPDFKTGSGFFVYDSYRHSVKFNAIESLSIWYNNLPPDKQVKCYISPVKALPMVENTIKNPTVTIMGETVMFPVEMESGSYIEFYSMDDCKFYGPKGEFRSNITPRGDIPVLRKGANTIEFTSEKTSDLSVRANVTVINFGDTIR